MAMCEGRRIRNAMQCNVRLYLNVHRKHITTRLHLILRSWHPSFDRHQLARHLQSARRLVVSYTQNIHASPPAIVAFGRIYLLCPKISNLTVLILSYLRTLPIPSSFFLFLFFVFSSFSYSFAPSSRSLSPLGSVSLWSFLSLEALAIAIDYQARSLYGRMELSQPCAASSY